MNPTKACPVVLRPGRHGVETLAFRHPLAGLQLVKGTIEINESPAEAAIRELGEEAGISAARLVRSLGIWNSGYKSQTWSFHQLATDQALADAWSHATQDDCGHIFQFFWHPIESKPSEEWHPVFIRALEYIQRRQSDMGSL